jgi:4-hydroxy 2-oxovalerate aldolase
MKAKILDCTLRDGGYYTNWDFDSSLVETYVESLNQLPVDYLEVGYRSNKLPGYLGEFFYCPIYVLRELRSKSNKKLAVILNEKDVRVTDVKQLLGPTKDYLDMVRLAIDPRNIDRALELAKAVKDLGYEVAFNVMYMSSWSEIDNFYDKLHKVEGFADYFYMVDSYGGVYPEDVKQIFSSVKERLSNVKIGFHGHNNLELALINTLTAMDCGVDIIDATVTGMGRGAGNLKTELLLTALNAKGNLNFDFNALSRLVDPFSKLQSQYEWGTNLPYMVSGGNSLPQKEVMDWVSKRYFSFNSIIRALSNQSKGIADNKQLPKLDLSGKSVGEVIIIGGGGSAKEHSRALHAFLEANQHLSVIHASSKNAPLYQDISNSQYFCLVGNEGHRLETVFSNMREVRGLCVLPPYPRKMGTYVPKAAMHKAHELSTIDFTDRHENSHSAIAIQTALELGAKKIYFAGYDGYSESKIGQKEQELFIENQFLFDKLLSNKDIEVISITPSKYDLAKESVYAMLENI